MMRATLSYGVATAATLLVVGGIASAYLGTPTSSPSPDRYPPPNYYDFLPPEVGATYVDPTFGTVIKRVSDARRAAPSPGSPAGVVFVTNEYSTVSPFNSDGSWLLLIHQSAFALYDGEGNYVKNLPRGLSASSEPRWSRQDPNRLYYVNGNQLRQLDVVTGISLLLRAFGEYGAVSGRGESDICFDGSHLVLTGDNREIFVYDLSTGRKGPVLATGGRPFDNLYITPDDNVLVGWLQAGSGRYNGVEMFDRNMSFLRQVARARGHMDVTRDPDGGEVLVWANAGDSLPVCDNGVVKIRLSDARQTCLLSLEWGLALHVSGPDNSGWVFVETYAPDDPAPEPGTWPPYANEILQLRLDGSAVRRLAHHRSRPFDKYNYQPRVSTNREGDKLVYSSNFGLQALLAYPTNYTDAYLLPVSPQAASRALRRSPGGRAKRTRP
jgi:hypothetical protein